MMKYAAICALLYGANAGRVDKATPCRKPRTEFKEGVVLTQLPDAKVPDQHRWDDVKGVNFLTTVRQQHMPEYCGSCWAQAAASSLSDRIKIMRNAQWPEINISPQVLISCEDPDLGCHGGDSFNAFEWIYNNEITDETCSLYQGRGHDNGIECAPIVKCKNCNPHEPCFVPDEYPIYKV